MSLESVVTNMADEYNSVMDVGIKEARKSLWKLVLEAQSGKCVYLVKRGKRVAQIVPTASSELEKRRGYGMWAGIVHLPTDWNSQQRKRKGTEEVLKLMGSSVE